jgi:DNA mismatch endonuclease (patch repair protein)
MDNLDSATRSWNMAQIRSKNTAPEIAVRSLLHGLGYRFRLHRSDLPGIPDIVLPKLRLAILVHGCFWHRHEKCRFAYSPKTREDFWQTKFEANVTRDKKVVKELQQMGWRVIIVWECETNDMSRLANRLTPRLAKYNAFP